MFTGIVEEAGAVEKILRTPKSIQLAIRAEVCAQGLKPGASLAVNGCCLTVVNIRTVSRRQKLLHFDLLRETWERTNLQFVHVGSHVNLERPLRADGRMDGHFVTGHIDGTGSIIRWEPVGADRLLEIAAPREILRYAVLKGSVAVDGISLTIAAVGEKSVRGL